MIILDQNISRKLVESLTPVFGEVVHVSLWLRENAKDLEIWEKARLAQGVIITKDADFYHRAIGHRPPPKVIWLNTGNETSRETLCHLCAKHQNIIDFIHQIDVSLLILEHI